MNETMEPLSEISDILPSSEYSEGQTSNVYNRLHENYVFWQNDMHFVLNIIDSG